MQPGYGGPGVNQHQLQLIDDDGFSASVFTNFNFQNQTHHPLYQPHHSRYQQHSQKQHTQQQQQMLPQQQAHSIPFTHQFFQHQLPAFQIQQQSDRLHQQLRQPCHPFFDVNFKLGLNENSGNNILNQEDVTFLRGNEQHISGIQQHSLLMPDGFRRSREDSAIKQPFWCNNKQCNEDKAQEIECKEYDLAFQPDDQRKERCNNLESKYRPFGELEEIYSLAKVVEINQTASGSALTGENSPKDAGLLMPSGDIQQCENVGETAGANTATGFDHGSDNSIGEETSLGTVQKRKRKRKLKEKLSSMAGFLESLVRQVIDHQDGLHRKFLEVIQRLDKERVEREAAWRSQEAAKYNREAIARAHEQALASNREALIVSHIEKITGQSINLPPRKTPLLLQPEVTKEPIKELTPMKIDSNSRWPKAEVEALIQVRCGLESRFLEPGLKGPLWEEVSSLMDSMGYQRSAKRCKEKWENINKYFRKTKESGKKRSLHSKTCAYFDHLDQLYFRTAIDLPSFSSNPSINTDIGVQSQGNLGLLKAFDAVRDLGIGQNTRSGNFKVSEMGPLRSDFDGIGNEKLEYFEQRIHGNEKENHEDDKSEDPVDVDEGED